MQIWLDLWQLSINEKKGLTFFLKGGHTIAGIVTAVNGTESVEAYNQVHDRIVIATDQIQAIAVN